MIYHALHVCAYVDIKFRKEFIQLLSMLTLHLDLSPDKCFPQSYKIFLLQLPCNFQGKNTLQAKIMWPEEGKIFRLKNKSLLCLQSDAAKVSCRAQLLAHCACLYLGSSPSLEWQRQAGFWCHCSLVAMDAN